MIRGGVVPGGIVLRRVWLMAVTSASADPMFASGWKKTRIRPTPASDCDSMCSMLLTVVVIARSEMVTMRPSTSLGERPVNCQMIEMTGMLIIWQYTGLSPNEVEGRSEEHTSELQSRRDLVCRLLLEKK